MISKTDIATILEAALRNPSVLEASIRRFQSLVWDTPETDFVVGSREEEVLRDLAYDLEYFVADPKARAEDTSYFGPERARSEIEAALVKLAAASGG